MKKRINISFVLALVVMYLAMGIYNSEKDKILKTRFLRPKKPKLYAMAISSCLYEEQIQA